MNMSSMFDGIDAVSSNQAGAYVQPGKHRFKVNALKQTDPKTTRSGSNFIAELVVVSSTCPDYTEGQRVSWISNITKGQQMALAEIKGFLAAVSGCKEDSITAAAADAACGPSQPFAGALIDCDAFQKPTQKGGVFTRTLWSAVKAGE